MPLYCLLGDYISPTISIKGTRNSYSIESFSGFRRVASNMAASTRNLPNQSTSVRERLLEASFSEGQGLLFFFWRGWGVEGTGGNAFKNIYTYLKHLTSQKTQKPKSTKSLLEKLCILVLSHFFLATLAENGGLRLGFQPDPPSWLFVGILDPFNQMSSSEIFPRCFWRMKISLRFTGYHEIREHNDVVLFWKHPNVKNPSSMVNCSLLLRIVWYQYPFKSISMSKWHP